MNWELAKEVGVLRYVARRIAWRVLSKTAQEPIPYRLPGDIKILLPPKSPFSADIYCTRGYVDWGSEQLLMQYLSQTGTKGCGYDVGANMGYYSVLLGAVTDHVFGFEPDPRNFVDLLAQPMVHFTHVPKAVSESCGTASFDVSEASVVGHLCTDGIGARRIDVETITLDSFRSTRPADERVTVVKMDVEGYEVLCLRGASELANRDRPVFLIEFGIDEGRPNTFAGLNDFISAHRYKLFAMIRRPSGSTSFRTVLEKLDPEALASLNHKMLFLVPEDETFFETKCAEGFCFEDMPRV